MPSTHSVSLLTAATKHIYGPPERNVTQILSGTEDEWCTFHRQDGLPDYWPLTLRSLLQPLVTETRPRRRGLDGYYQLVSLFWGSPSLLYQLWATPHNNSCKSLRGSRVCWCLGVCIPGHPWVRVCPEGAGTTSAEALWKEEEPGCQPHPGRDTQRSPNYATLGVCMFSENISVSV